jgi:arylsulfatase A
MSELKFFWTAIFCSLFIASCQKSTSDNRNSRPNILLILADDMGYGDVSNSGNKYLKTPHLDELANKSVNFKNFYVSPVCAPTRVSLLTGRYHQEVGVRSVTNGFEIMVPEAVTLAEILKLEGYRTAIFGKWHLGEYYPSVPNAQGFDEYLGFRTGHTSNYLDPVLEHNGKPEKTQGYITDVLTNKALNYMKTLSNELFFCYLAYNAPHSPLQIEVSKFQKFLDMGLDEKTSRVYAMVENIDENIGKIIAWLEITGKLENTIIIFLSDNGPISGWQIPQEQMRYNAGLRDQKFTTYEGGIRTQCYWMWKGHWQPIYDSLSIAAHIDVVPTLAHLLNIDLPDTLGIDGYDLSDALEKQLPVGEKRIYFEDFHLDALRTPQLFNG